MVRKSAISPISVPTNMAPSQHCCCRLCQRKGNPVDARTIRKHIDKYGRFESDVESLSESEVTPPCSENEIYEFSSPLKFANEDSDNDGDSGGSGSRSSEEDNTTTEKQMTDLSQGDNSTVVDASMDDSDESTTETENEDVSSDESSSDTGDNDSIWSCDYGKNLYEEGIATTKIEGSNVTLLQWLALNMNLFSSHPSISKSAFSDFLLLQKQFQMNSLLPGSYEEARKLIYPYLLKKKIFSVCEKECVIFRNTPSKILENLDHCPVCNTSRYHQTQGRRPVSRRTFTYLPVGPRLARLYGEVNLAQLIQSHGGSAECMEEDEMWDIHDSPTWKEQYSEDGYFAGNNMGISLALELDGVNPYHNIGVMYSMTPMMLTVLNLPRYMRNAFGNIMLVGIIPANNRSESTRLDPYIEILVDELLFLSGCQTYSAYHNAPVEMKVKLLLYVLDYPGMSKLFGQHGSGSLMGCHWCLIRGFRCRHLDKVIYLYNRSYLPMSNEVRQDTEHFVNKLEDISQKPASRTQLAETEYRKAYESAKNKTQAGILATATGCKGLTAISNFPGHDRIEESQPDACHTIKDVVQNIMNLICQRNVNVEKILKSEREYGRFAINSEGSQSPVLDSEYESSFSHAQKRSKVSQKQSSVCNQQMPFFLSKEELKLADERASKLRPPTGFGIKPSGFITKPGSLKSHDWKQLASQGILKYCLRGMLATEQRESLFLFFDCISEICAEKQLRDSIDELEVKVNIVLARLERDFPVSLQNITTHLLHHVVDGLRKFGPVYGTWMYVFERFNSWICKRALNMRHPESTAVETFIIFDWCQFMKASGKMPNQPVNVGLVTPESIELEEATIPEECKNADYNGRKNAKLKKYEIQAIGRLTKHECTECSYEQYYHHKEIHAKTHREVHFGCSLKESTEAKTISSVVFREQRRGPPSTKVQSGKFVQFGRIVTFITCLCKQAKLRSNVAKVQWYLDTHFDCDSGLWYVENTRSVKVSYCIITELSSPLLTAVENNIMWICNSGLSAFRM